MSPWNIIYGFTGTRAGMTTHQQQHLKALLARKRARGLHHGDCVGADAEAHELAQGLDIVIHPPEDAKHRAFCIGASEVLPPKPYLERNHDIVDACNVLIAAPKEDTEQLRSGTWATVRYARKQGKPVVILTRLEV